jgi:hypothetical protein
MAKEEAQKRINEWLESMTFDDSHGNPSSRTAQSGKH